MDDVQQPFIFGYCSSGIKHWVSLLLDCITALKNRYVASTITSPCTLATQIVWTFLLSSYHRIMHTRTSNNKLTVVMCSCKPRSILYRSMVAQWSVNLWLNLLLELYIKEYTRLLMHTAPYSYHTTSLRFSHLMPSHMCSTCFRLLSESAFSPCTINPMAVHTQKVL